MRTCKLCAKTEAEVLWVVKHGLSVGRVCRPCSSNATAVSRLTTEGRQKKKEANKKCSAALRSTESGRLKANLASYSCRSTEEAKFLHREANRLYQAVCRSTDKGKAILKERTRLWVLANPGKANAITAKRRSAKLKRTPNWSEYEAIKQFYINCPSGHQVDHIIPLQGELVSGLHVLGNLQYLTATENARKKNKFFIN